MKNMDTFQPIKQILQEAKVDNPLETILCLDMKLYLQDNLLVKLDRISMASSLEVRVPFLDHHIVDFVTKLPPSFKLKWLKSKYLLKKCGQTILPKPVIHRKKKGFGIPVSEWIRGELYNIFQDMLSADRIKREGLFNPHFIGKLLEDHLARRYNNRKSLWTLFMFEQWVSSYLNGTPTIDDKSPSYESLVHSPTAHG
jgi:asparagine synthase (glutamine-hydrolysing)